MFSITTPWMAAAVLGGLIVLVGVGAVLFQAGCALADVPGRGYFRSLGISFLPLVIGLPMVWGLLLLAGQYEADPSIGFSGLRLAGLAASLLVTWLAAAGIYALLLGAPVRKGLVIAGVELLLMGLLSALVAAVVLVVLALAQIVNQPPPVKTSSPAPPALRA